MDRRWSIVSAVVALASAGLIFGQAPPGNRIIGVVIEIQASGAKVKTDAGEVCPLVFLPETRFQKVAPGEKDLSRAQTIGAADLAVGDRVLARGTLAEDQKSLAAVSVIVMSRSDLARKHEQERAEWVRRGTAGLVVSTDPAAKEIKIRIPSMFGAPRMMTVVLGDNTRLRRYAPDSVRFADARPSTLAEVKQGDQLRALGNKSEDGSRFAAEEVVTGSFRTVAGTVVSVNGQAGELLMKDLDSGKTLTVAVTPGSTLRRLPPFPAGPMGPRGPGGVPDLQQMLERLPAITPGELKPGETIVVSSTRGARDDRLTAVTLLAGADSLVAMAQAAAARSQGQTGPPGSPSMGTWNLGDISMIPVP